MPFELELEDVVEGALPPDELELPADELELPADELEVWAAGVLVFVDEPEELEPHAATPRATSTSRAAAQRRGDLVVVEFMKSLLRCQDPSESRVNP